MSFSHSRIFAALREVLQPDAITVADGGDILSYVRLMALGMVGSGFGMAINVLVKLVSGAPYVGWLLGALVWGDGTPLRISLDRTDLWDLRPVPEHVRASGRLPAAGPGRTSDTQR